MLPLCARFVVTAVILGNVVSCTKEAPSDRTKSSGPETGDSRGREERTSTEAQDVVAQGTSSKNGVYFALVEWVQGPRPGAGNELIVTFALPNGQRPQVVESLALEPWMPSHGHGTVVEDQTFEAMPDSPGRVRISGVNFVMGGPWDLALKATVDGTADTVTFAVDVK